MVAVSMLVSLDHVYGVFLSPHKYKLDVVKIQVIVVAMQVRPVKIQVIVVELHLSCVEIHVRIVKKTS